MNLLERNTSSQGRPLNEPPGHQPPYMSRPALPVSPLLPASFVVLPWFPPFSFIRFNSIVSYLFRFDCVGSNRMGEKYLILIVLKVYIQVVSSFLQRLPAAIVRSTVEPWRPRDSRTRHVFL